MKKLTGCFTLNSRAGLAALLLAGAVMSTQANATDHPRMPADLVSGHCGTGHLIVEVAGKHETVSCDNVNTHTGEAYFKVKRCDHRKHKHHCVDRKVYIQLPVLSIQKWAYRHGRVITTNVSDTFHINVSNNHYSKNLGLKSKQKASLIVSAGGYGIHETAQGYNESIRCDSVGKSSDTGSINGIHVGKGQKVHCSVFNHFIEPVKPVKPVKPAKPMGHKPPPPKHCEVTVYGTLAAARVAYSKTCAHIPRKDCDLTDHGRAWTCSSEQIGSASPNLRH